MTTVTENGNLVVTNEYDTNNRVSSQTHPDGGTYAFSYTMGGGNITETSMTAPNSAVTTWRFYDDDGNYRNGYIMKKITPDGTTTYNREAGSNLLLSVTDPLGKTRTYTYYANGLVHTMTDSVGNTTSYEYESYYGRPTKITDALSMATTFTYTYDPNNRITKVVIEDLLLNQTTINSIRSQEG